MNKLKTFKSTEEMLDAIKSEVVKPNEVIILDEGQDITPKGYSKSKLSLELAKYMEKMSNQNKIVLGSFK